MFYSLILTALWTSVVRSDLLDICPYSPASAKSASTGVDTLKYQIIDLGSKFGPMNQLPDCFTMCPFRIACCERYSVYDCILKGPFETEILLSRIGRCFWTFPQILLCLIQCVYIDSIWHDISLFSLCNTLQCNIVDMSTPHVLRTKIPYIGSSLGINQVMGFTLILALPMYKMMKTWSSIFIMSDSLRLKSPSLGVMPTDSNVTIRVLCRNRRLLLSAEANPQFGYELTMDSLLVP
jgi:hypothetical protein